MTPDRPREHPDDDGPLIRRVSRQADDLDRATTSRRSRAWAALLGALAAALLHSFLRETFIWGAVLFSAFTAIYGGSGDDLAWALPMIAAGVGGIVLVLWSLAHHWTILHQWAVFVGVVAAQVATIVVYARVH